MESGRRRIGLATIPVLFILLSLAVASGAAVFHLPSAKPAAQANFWYVGATSSNASYLSNQGIRGEIQVVEQRNVSSFLAFWVSETMSNNLWGQVGYYVYQNSEPIAFFQVWNLTNRQEIGSGRQSLSPGEHVFSMSLKEKTTFEFSVDSSVIGYYDMHTDLSSPRVPLYALSEEGYCSAPFSFLPVSFGAVQVLQEGRWHGVNSLQSYGSSWGMTSMKDNAFAVGGSYSTLPGGTSLS